MAPLLVTATDAAKLLGVSRRWFHTMVAEGRIRPVVIGTAKRYRKSDLDKFVATLKPAR